VKESARHYSDVMDDFADQALLANVLRARDYAPMNFNDLSAITGALSLSGTAAFTVPFGPFIGLQHVPSTGTTVGTFRNTFSPGVTGSTSPVINIGTLNTQGFMMTMVQPISTTYLLSKWDSYPHELLLSLFIKSIRFPGEEDNSSDLSHKKAYRNDPDSEPEFRDFQDLIEKMIAQGLVAGTRVGNVDMKSLMILDRLGNPVPMGKILTSTTPIPSQTLSMAAPGAPKLDSVSGNLAADTTYYTQVTYVTSLGETLPSLESSLKLMSTGNNQRLRVSLQQSAPPQGASYAIAYNVYVGMESGKETRQNQKPLGLGTPWTLPDSGLVAGGYPPGGNSLPYATTLPLYPGTQYQVAGDYNIFQTISGLTDGQLHAGNARCPDYVKKAATGDAAELCPKGSPAPFVQFYKEYPAQIVLCLDVEENDYFYGHYIYGSAEAKAAYAQLPTAKQQLQTAQLGLATVNSQITSEIIHLDELSPGEARREQEVIKAQRADAQERVDAAQKMLDDLNTTISISHEKGARAVLYAMSKTGGSTSASTSGTTPSAGGGGGGGGGSPGGGGSGSGGSTSGAMGQVTLALQPNRISAIVPSTMCRGDQFVLHQESEEAFDQESGRFTHIEWRSIAEVIQYLGAVARYQDRHATTDHNVIGWPALAHTDRLFTYAKGVDGRIQVDYRDGPYSVPANLSPALVDHSLQTLALLNELVSIAKISGTLPVPQPVQVLP
jgi:hypothetical protein